MCKKTIVRVSFFIKLLAEKFIKTHKETPVPVPGF